MAAIRCCNPPERKDGACGEADLAERCLSQAHDDGNTQLLRASNRAASYPGEAVRGILIVGALTKHFSECVVPNTRGLLNTSTMYVAHRIAAWKMTGINPLSSPNLRLTQALPPGLSTTAISADRLLRHRPLAPLGCRLLRRLQPQHALTAPAP